MAQQQPLYDKVIREGEKILNGTNHGPERKALQSRLNNSKKRWEEVKDATGQRAEDIEELYPRSKSYDESSVTFSCWLMKAETHRYDLMNSPLTADRDLIHQRQRQIDVSKSFCLIKGRLFTQAYA